MALTPEEIVAPITNLPDNERPTHQEALAHSSLTLRLQVARALGLGTADIDSLPVMSVVMIRGAFECVGAKPPAVGVIAGLPDRLTSGLFRSSDDSEAEENLEALGFRD